MGTCSRKRRGAGFTLVDMVIVVFVLAVLAALLLPALARQREESCRIPCRNNLNQLAKGMYTYLNEYGDNRFYPCPLGRGMLPNDYTGGEWLASLYWTQLVPDPGVFICPDNGENWNNDGFDLGTDGAPPGGLGPLAVSYAGMHYYSMTDKAGRPEAGAIRDDFPPNLPMGSDDTEGDINHGTTTNGGMTILFFDSHVEFRTNTEVDVERAVGQEGGLLWQLRN